MENERRETDWPKTKIISKEDAKGMHVWVNALPDAEPSRPVTEEARKHAIQSMIAGMWDAEAAVAAVDKVLEALGADTRQVDAWGIVCKMAEAGFLREGAHTGDVRELVQRAIDAEPERRTCEGCAFESPVSPVADGLGRGWSLCSRKGALGECKDRRPMPWPRAEGSCSFWQAREEPVDYEDLITALVGLPGG